MKKLLRFKWLFFLTILGSLGSVSAQTSTNKEVSKTLFFTANTGFKKNSASKGVLKAITKASQNAENASFG